MRTCVARSLAIAPLVLGAIALASAAGAADREADALPFTVGPGQGVFLIISDIHFDPFADPAIVGDLVDAEVDAWPAIFERSKQTGLAPYGEDVNDPLLRSMLEAARRLLPQPDFVLYPGDYLVHEFQRKFDPYAGGGPAAYERFVVKTLTFVSDRLHDAFPGVQIYGALGNVDSFCGDYMIAPGETFLAEVGKLWAAHSTHPEAFRDFDVGGFYVVPHPTVPGRDLIVLNNIFWSPEYEDRCDPEGGDPGAAEMAWLEWILYRIEARGRTASLLLHIPPGIDSYKSSHGGDACRDRVLPFLKEPYAQAFQGLLERYKRILRDAWSGHTHMDDFRVVATAAGEPILLTHITPAVSPIYLNNPGFGVVLYERASGQPIDYATVYLTNLERAGRGEEARWAVEYTFKGAYGYPVYDPRSATELAQAIRSDPAIRDDYIAFFPVETSAPDPPINQQNWEAFACAQTEMTPEAFAACYCD